jgi:hypothetical protein
VKQTYPQIAAEKVANKAKKLEEIEREIRLIRTKVKFWMARNCLPHKMKEPIINCIQQRLKENKDFDMDKLISHLSKDLVIEIKHHLCLPLLQIVSFFFFFNFFTLVEYPYTLHIYIIISIILGLFAS